MKKRNFIVLGDRTSHGGEVITAWGRGRWDIDGFPVACVDDKVTCPRCKGTHTIITGAQNPPVYCHGRRVAREGDHCSDGSILISVKQSRAWHEEDGSGEAAAGASAASGLLVAQNKLALPDEGFCMECWLKAMAARSPISYMPEAR